MRLPDRKAIKRMKKSLVCLGLSLSMLLTGCGKETAAEPEIELIDPVSSSVLTETVCRRTIYDSEVIEGNVFPEVTEYSTSVRMKSYDISYFPGQTVGNGSVILTGDMQDYYDQEKKLQDTIDNLIITYAENRRVQEAMLREYKKYIIDRDDLLDIDVDLAINVQGAIMARDFLLQTMDDEELIHELDLAHNYDLLNRLQANEAKRRVTSHMYGTVVAVSEATPGTWISEGTNVAAVTDGKSLMILATYRSAKEMSGAKEYYAVIGGSRVGVTYRPYSASELSALKASGSTYYSIFDIDDPEGVVKAGDKVSIVIIYDKRDDVLSVSSEAVHRDEGGYYVKLLSGDKIYITRGITDGMFTEILDGLSEGDEVLLNGYNEVPENVATLARGDYYVKYEGTGFLSYPDITNITNNVKYGTVTLVEKSVVQGQRVKRGDVIAYVSVTPDSIKLEELTVKLLRLNEKREQAQEAVDDPSTIYLDEDDQEKLKNAVSTLDRQIKSTTDQITEIQNAYNITAFYSPVDGVVGYITDLSDGAVLKSAERIATVASDSSEYLYAANDAGTLCYGMGLTGEYKDPVTGTVTEFPLTVSSVSFGAVSKDLALNKVYIKPAAGTVIPGGAHDTNSEFSAQIPSGQTQTAENPWEEYLMRQEAENAPKGQSYKITGYLQYETGVVLVPAKAVTTVGDQNYVTVLKDGKYIKISFIAGGPNPLKSVTIDGVAYIWAIEGLEEGMVVVY